MHKKSLQRSRERLIDHAILEVDRLRDALREPAPCGTDCGEGFDPARLAGAHAELVALAGTLATCGPVPETITEAPACSMRDTGSEIEALFELPGIPRGSLRVRYTAGYLVVEGNRPDSSEDGPSVLAARPRSGPFRQTVSVPIPIDATGGSALYREGCLTIRLPKRGGASARQSIS